MEKLCIALILVASALVACVEGHNYYLGQCPSVDPMENFDMSKFMGRWYAIQKFSTASSCWTYDFIRNASDGSLKVVQSRDHVVLDTIGLDNNYRYTGSLDVPDPNRPAFMRARFPMSVAGKSDYVVFATDYENYGAIYTCQSILFGHRRSATILSRTKTLAPMFVNKVRTKLEGFGVDPHDFSIISHEDCHVLPSSSILNFGVGPDSLTNAVKATGQAIGTGVEYVANGVGTIYNTYLAPNSSSPAVRSTLAPENEVETFSTKRPFNP